MSPTRTYVKGGISVEWYPEFCTQCKQCHTNLPHVFDPVRRPWVDLSQATDAEIIETVSKCPSGALELVDVRP
jgi:uncharacterized Fe-S cluster protein YjdI